MRSFHLALLSALSLSIATAAQTPITLHVDLTDAPRKILHATETVPVQPGPVTLVYPKWIPGEHMPSGPIDNQAGFTISANGQPVKWERDKVDMFAYHVIVPAGVTKLDIKMDFLVTAAASGFSAGASTSANLALLSWNSVIVYPFTEGMHASDVMVTPSIKLQRKLEVRHRTRNESRKLSRILGRIKPSSRPSPSNNSSIRPSSRAAGSARFLWPPTLRQSISSTSPATVLRTLPSRRSISTSSRSSSTRPARCTSRATTARIISSSRCRTRLRTSGWNIISLPTTASRTTLFPTTTSSSSMACCCRMSLRTRGTGSIAVPPGSLRRTIRSRWKATCCGCTRA